MYVYTYAYAYVYMYTYVYMSVDKVISIFLTYISVRCII